MCVALSCTVLPALVYPVLSSPHPERSILLSFNYSSCLSCLFFSALMLTLLLRSIQDKLRVLLQGRSYHVSELPNAAKNKIPDPMMTAAFFTESHSPPGPSWAEKKQQLCQNCAYTAAWWWWAVSVFLNQTLNVAEMSKNNKTAADTSEKDFLRATCFHHEAALRSRRRKWVMKEHFYLNVESSQYIT